MKCINHYIYITFDESDRFAHQLPNGMSLIIPKVWQHTDEYGMKTDKQEENHNQLETNPQVGYVLAGNPNHPDITAGNKVYLHFLAYTNRQPIADGYMIDARDVFFLLDENDNPVMLPKTYLGTQIIEEAPRSARGIYLTPGTDRKVECRIRITHVPAESPAEFTIGAEVISVDKAQYPIEYAGVKYIKLAEHEIVGIVDEVQAD